jgi:DNA adenine methylase
MSTAPQRYASPLRYPGGKAQVINFLKLLMLENDLLGSEYIELYAGGASVALSLLFEDYVSAVHINDLNIGVHAFWQSILHQTDDFCALVDEIPLTVEEWQRQRGIAASNDSGVLERGFATFYLNRTNRSGIIRGGIIGGLDQSGPWKMDARFPRAELIRRIRKAARFRSRITLTRVDALDLLLLNSPSTDTCRFYFLDPPYYSRGERLYDNFYSYEDHQKIHDAVINLGDPWIVSYDAAPEIMRMYGECCSLRYSLSYSANSRVRGSEVMFSSSGLALPEEAPTNVSLRRVDEARFNTLMLPFDYQ